MLKDGITLTDEVKEYLKEEDIHLLKYYSNLGVIELEVDKELDINNLRYIEALELERSFTVEK